MISPCAVQDAVAETHRCVRELGFRGVFLRPNAVNGRNRHDSYYERAVERAGGARSTAGVS